MNRRRTTEQSEAPTKLSRGDIETLCVLHVVGDEGCPVEELAARLGLSASIAVEVAAGMDSLVNSGLLVIEDGTFYLTDAGADRLEKRAGASSLSLFDLL